MNKILQTVRLSSLLLYLVMTTPSCCANEVIQETCNSSKLAACPVVFLDEQFVRNNDPQVIAKNKCARTTIEKFNNLLIQFQQQKDELASAGSYSTPKYQLIQERNDALSAQQTLCSQVLYSEEYYIKIREREKNRVLIATAIAKELGACAVINIESNNFTYMDPAYDITSRVMEQLNMSYEEPPCNTPPACKIEIPKDKELSPQERLLEAITNNLVNEIDQAVKDGANVNQEHEGKTPLFWAVLLNKTSAVEHLLQHGAKANEGLIQVAATSGNIKAAVLMAKKFGSFNKPHEGKTLFQHALIKRDVESILTIIQSGAAPYVDQGSIVGGNTVYLMDIALSASNQNIGLELLQELINRGYNVNDIWRYGIGVSSDVNPSGVYGFPKAIELFIRNGANPNLILDHCPQDSPHHLLPKTTPSSWTPLLRTIKCGDIESVKVLLNAGADVNLKASPNIKYVHVEALGLQSPLSFAMAWLSQGPWCNKEIVPLLIERGAIL